MARRFRATIALLATTAAMAAGRPAAGALSLAGLSQPTVQTLIDLGTDGVTVGPERFYDFSYAASGDAPAAADVAVTPAATGTGLRFVGAWVADAAEPISSGTVGYDVAPVDPAAALAGAAVVANGTAPVPATGTFATTSLWALDPTGAPVVAVLSTYDDGQGTAAETDADSATLADAAATLAVTQTVTAVATGDGVATASAVQDTFAVSPKESAVPEPATSVALAVATGLVLGRRVPRKAK